MRYTLVTAATEEPLLVQDVIDQCQLGAVPDDQRVRVAAYIAGARQLLERRLCRQFVTATWKATMDAFPPVIEIRDKLPIKSIVHVKYYDTNGTQQTLSSSLYQTDFVSENSPARIVPAIGQAWPSVQGDKINAVEVQFTCGYGAASAVPSALKNGMLLLVANWYENREQTIVGTIASQLPWGVEACITPEDWGAYS